MSDAPANKKQVCASPGCMDLVSRNGLCKSHYYFFRRYGTASRVPCGNRKPLQVTHPEIAEELAEKKFGEYFTSGSKIKVEWICKKGHRYYASICNRTNKKKLSGCIFCNKITFDKSKSLLKKRPDLACEAFMFDPLSYGTSSRSSLMWSCSKCGHIWKARIDQRVAGSGCPECNKGTFKTSMPAWIYLISRPGQQKVGITNKIKGKDNRISHHRGNGWEILDLVGPCDGRLIKDKENEIKAALDFRKIPRGRLAFRECFDGYSESWQTVDLYAFSVSNLLEVLGLGGIHDGQREKAEA